MALNSSAFYREWHGHRANHLKELMQGLGQPQRSRIFLVGDSSLDNKYWVNERSPAINGFEKVLDPPMMKEDVAFWMNQELLDRGLGQKFVCVNCAVEATRIVDRKPDLLPQDAFVRENIREDDILVVSIGGNDVVLGPSAKTVFSMLSLVYLTLQSSIENGGACSLRHFVHLFRDEVKAFVERVIGDRKPKKVVVCMIYYLDEDKNSESWANTSLSALRYNANPRKLQAMIKRMYESATKEIHIDGVEVIPVPLFQVMDGSNPQDYVARVEPSSQGGHKMANLILDSIFSGPARSSI